ncbi:hypothetical protein [Streptomyces zhihengii]|uniref:hypothetical protein n=1 Tax=Streptomyces zhihengii TaxID=1818004 RepID=UPI0033B6B9D2
MSDNEEEEYLHQLVQLLEGARRFDPYTSENSGEWEVQPGSCLAVDDAASHPYRVSHSAWHALTVAVDHLQCLRSSMMTADDAKHASTVIHTHAQATLLRAVFENSARAVWLLDPVDHLERITRSLRLQFKETKNGHRVRDIVGAPSLRTQEEACQRLDDLLVAAGGARDTARKTLKNAPTYKDIVREAGAATGIGEEIAELLWSACSALAHGDTTATLLFLDREIVQTDGDVGLMKVNGSIPLLRHVTLVAVQMLDSGFSLYAQRAKTHVQLATPGSTPLR